MSDPPTRRIHPCLIPALIYSASVLAGVVLLGVGQKPLLGGLLALLGLTIAAPFVAAVARGFPEVSLPETERLVSAIDAVEGEDKSVLIRVTVQNDTISPCRYRRARSPIIFGATSFIQSCDEETLRAVAALQLSELRDRGMARSTGRLQYVSLFVLFASALAADLAMPRNWGPVAVAASLAAATWLARVLVTLFSRGPWVERAYERTDAAAVEMAGSRDAVVRALRAMARWRSERRATLSTLTRVLERGAQPVPADWRESERAARLSDR